MPSTDGAFENNEAEGSAHNIPEDKFYNSS